MRHPSRALGAAILVGVAGAAWTGMHDAHGGGRVVTVVESDFKIKAPAVVQAGTVRLRIRNDGPDTHELLLARSPSGRLPFRPDGLTVDEDALHVTNFEGQESGKTGELTVRLRPGRYILFCNMAGHYLSGMHRTLVVR